MYTEIRDKRVIYFDHVTITVPGCADLDQLADALAWFDNAADVSHLLPNFSSFGTGDCVHCNHCLPCPSNSE